MPRNTKTLLDEMMKKMETAVVITRNDKLPAYLGPEHVQVKAKHSWVLKYGEGLIVFQYIPKNRVNIAVFDTDSEPYYSNIAFADDDLMGMQLHLHTAARIIEEGIYAGCIPSDVYRGLFEYKSQLLMDMLNLDTQ